MMTRKNVLKQIIAAGIGGLAIVASGYAQKLETGQFEATGQVGIVAGTGTHASFAGSIGGAVTERVFVSGEFGWIPLGGASTTGASPGSTFEFATSGRILSFMAGAHYQFRETHSFVPYAGAALGLVHGSQSFTSTVGGATFESNTTSNNLYVSFGGGARYYVNDHWGFKPEFMVFAGSDTFFRFGAGVFYTFGR